MRLGILASHPIQYQAPLFRALAEKADIQVFFAHRQTPTQQAAAGFGVLFEWDTDLLSGYPYRFLANRARQPSVDRFFGTDLPEIHAVIEAGRFDGFLVTGWHLRGYWQAIDACRRHGVPVLVRGDSQLGTPRSRVKRLAKEIVYRRVLQQFDGFLHVGQRNREYLLHYGAAPDRLFHVPHFVDNEWFRRQAVAAGPDLPALRQGLGLGVKDRVVLFAGKLIAKKRPSDVIRAMSVLRRRGAEDTLVVVGSGPLHADLERLADELNVAIRLVGFQNQSEIARWYAMADLLVLPSDGGETWGLVVNEAMACGTPAVVSDAVGCGPDLIVEGVTGSVYPMADTTALAGALGLMLGRKAEPAVQNALAAVTETHSVTAAVAGVLEAVDQVGRGRR